MCRALAFVTLAGSREAHGEGRALTQRALDGDVAIHHASDVAADRESQPGSLTLALVDIPHLDERLEDRLELVRWDAGSRITNADEDLGRVAVTRDRYRPARRRVA